MTKRVLSSALNWLRSAFLVACTLFVTGHALAANAINSATVDGGSSTTVASGATITATVTNVTNGGTSWGSTQWYIGAAAPGTWNCDTAPTPTISANGTNTVTLVGPVIAPVVAGIYNTYFRTSSSNSSCSNNLSSTYTLANSVIVVTAPTATTSAATSLSATGATLNGTVASNRATTAVSFEYGTTTSYGNSVTATPSSLAASASSTTVSAALTGLTCNTTYHFRVKGVNSEGTGNGGDLSFTTSACPFTCTPPSNIPSGVSVTCQCDTFGRVNLNPSTIFNSNWVVSTSDSTGIVPSIVNSGYLRLTNNTGNNAKAATVPGIFPAAGNYISVEFQQYAYNGSGADGLAVTLSDYSVPAVPGAYGGSLGYAQETGIHDGFAGGWLGVALDEYGNYQNPTEGRLGGSGFIVQSVGARGSGSGQSGYRWLGGTSSLSPEIDNNTSSARSRGFYYQVVVDARGEPTSTAVAVNRDTGGGYVSLVSIPNVYTAAIAQGFTQAAVPSNWQISFTGSTGGSTNIHEIGNLRICASSMIPPGGGTASGFNAIDEDYGTPPAVAVQNYLTGHIYTKLVGTSFKLNVAALNNSQILSTYAVGGAKTVTVKLVDNSDSVLDSTKDCTLSCTSTCTGKPAVAGGTQTLTYASGATDKGQKQSPSFTINTAYQKLVAIISDGTTTACSTDSFSVRPQSVASVVSVETPVGAGNAATNAATSGTPVFKAGSGNFALTATTTGIAGSPSGYTGVLKIDNALVAAVSPAAVKGFIAPLMFPAATSGTPSSIATGTTFTYSEVGAFLLPGYPVTDTISPRGVFDGVRSATECSGLTVAQCDLLKAATWTGVDSISTISDCVPDSYSNTKVGGKFGCNFGIVSNTNPFGRFIPDGFVVSAVSVVPRSDIGACSTSSFTYLGEPFRVNGLTLTATAAGGTTTQNYTGTLAKLDLSSALTSVSNVGVGAQQGVSPSFINFFNAARLVAAYGGTSFSDTYPATDPDCPSARTLAWCKGKALMALDLTINRGSAPDGPFAGTVLGISPVDSDGVKMNAVDFQRNYTGTGAIVGDGKILALLTGNELRYGRLKLSNVFGTDKANLGVPVQAQYWSGLTWVQNAADSCTPIAKAAVKLTGALSASNTVSADVTLSGGGATFLLKCPYATCPFPGTPSPALTGTVGLCVDLGADPALGVVCAASTSAALPYLQGKWPPGSNYDNDPSARATFGVYAPETRKTVHVRELY